MSRVDHWQGSALRRTHPGGKPGNARFIAAIGTMDPAALSLRQHGLKEIEK
jgi:hypothetical protein